MTKLIQQDGYLSEAKQMRHGYIKVFQIVLVSIFASGQPSWGHHGDAGRYNDEVSTVVGVVAQWRMINPHSVLILDVEDELGKVTRWRGELGNPTNLGTRYGWTAETFLPGRRLSMTGRALKNGSPAMTLSEGAILVDVDTDEELYRQAE
ncbi:MAG: DUF6152 family protein [Candidatus Rariloculaceae bacterium]